MSKIGVCKVDITPPVGIDFVEYHRETGINNIEERIYGTVFVFEKDESKWIRFLYGFLFTRQVVYLMIISLYFL